MIAGIKRLWTSLFTVQRVTIIETYTINGQPMTPAERAAFDAAFGTMGKAFEQMGEAFDLVRQRPDG